jgi:hypothetical protein
MPGSSGRLVEDQHAPQVQLWGEVAGKLAVHPSVTSSWVVTPAYPLFPEKEWLEDNQPEWVATALDCGGAHCHQ